MQTTVKITVCWTLLKRLSVSSVQGNVALKLRQFPDGVKSRMRRKQGIGLQHSSDEMTVHAEEHKERRKRKVESCMYV